MASMPNNLQPVEYVYSSGYQFINTLVKSADDIRIDARIQYEPASSGSAAYNGVTASDNKLYIGKNTSNKFSFGYGSSDIASSVTVDNKVHNFSIDCVSKKYSIDGTQTSFSGSDLVGGEYIYMFGGNNGDYTATSNVERIYSFNIYKNGSIIKRFIPVKALSASRNIFPVATASAEGSNNGITVKKTYDYYRINGTATADATVDMSENETHFLQAFDGSYFTACANMPIPDGMSIVFSVYEFNAFSRELFTLDSEHPTGTDQIEITSAMRGFTKIVVSFKVDEGNTVDLDNFALQIERGEISNGFEPAYGSGVGLMYETVEGKIYMNDTTGRIDAGPNAKLTDSIKTISLTKDGETKDVKKIEHNGKIIWSNWRSRFDKLEYIQSTGTQYIDTGIKGNINTEAEYSVNKVTSSTQNTISVFGDNSDSSSAVSLNVETIDSSGRNSRFGNKAALVTNISTNTLHTMSINRNNVIIDNNIVGTFNTTDDFTTVSNLLYGKIGGDAFGPTYFDGDTRLYECKIYNHIGEERSIIRDFIPAKAKRNSRNLLERPIGTKYVSSGLTSTHLADKIVLSGTATADWVDNYSRITLANPIPAGTYTFSIAEPVSFNITLRTYVSGGSYTNINIPPNTTSVTFTTTEPITQIYTYTWLTSSTGTVYNNYEILEPMLVAGNTTQDYEPYFATGTAGLYDTINDKFYANSGTGVFTAGPVIE